MSDVPDSRRRLDARIVRHLERLGEGPGVDRIAHPEMAEALGSWIATHREPDKGLSVIVVCTGNSRRSILGATMGNVVAAYLGRPEVRFFSGGTEPSAFNPRTVAALEAIGVVVTPTGDLAPPGPSAEPNPVYRVRWGAVPGDPETEAIEFSKRYDDASNPRSGFAALLVCDEADAGCPVVPGASIRLAIPFADPKEADGTPEESARYAGRRDDLGRWMLHALSRAR
ncbi:protein-tyrosine-phosphatase [Tautonia sp. JC769]|uniref:protein-tyrosine-phosphatase n=1 Tax=Tautonia sp. JC769 TaxID=3232135 RepID=UPI00345775C7